MMACEKCGSKRSLCPVSLGLALGITNALFMLFFAWIAAMSGHGMEIIDQYGSFYLGYASSLVGGLIGAVWGLITGFITGALIGFFYNYILCYCKSKSCCGKPGEGCSK